MKRSSPASPKARKHDLVTRQIPGELLVYDLKRHKAFCLNETAATIWKNCNGQTTVGDLAALLAQEHDAPVDEKVVWLALDQLEKSRLLQTRPIKPANEPAISRRSLLRAGLITAVTLPVVTMITAPVAAQAGTPITAAVCATRSPSNCGGNPCSDAKTGKVCRKVGKICKCQ